MQDFGILRHPRKDQQAIQRLNELNNGMDKSESLISRKMEEAKAFQD